MHCAPRERDKTSTVAALVHAINPKLLANVQFVNTLTNFLVLDNLILILIAVGVLGAYINFNVLSWFMLGLTWVLSMLPIPGIRGLWGVNGRSAGWIQAYWICRQMDDGKPLLISKSDIDRLAGTVLLKLTGPKHSQDFAERPESTDKVFAPPSWSRWHAVPPCENEVYSRVEQS